MELHLLILIFLFLLPAILAAFSMELLRAAISLLVCSVGLTLILFNLNAPLAGVFELSVCAGLITVLFINAISLTRPLSGEEQTEKTRDHYKRFAFLPLVVILVGLALWFNREQWASMVPIAKLPVSNEPVGEILWGTRGLDLIGQIAILLIGVYGVVVLFKRGKLNDV